MSDTEKLEDEVPETATDAADDAPDVEGHKHFKRPGGVTQDAERPGGAEGLR
jgi:hypothetical protein